MNSVRHDSQYCPVQPAAQVLAGVDIFLSGNEHIHGSIRKQISCVCLLVVSTSLIALIGHFQNLRDRRVLGHSVKYLFSTQNIEFKPLFTGYPCSQGLPELKKLQNGSTVWMMALSVTLSVTPPLCHYNRTVRYCALSIASITV